MAGKNSMRAKRLEVPPHARLGAECPECDIGIFQVRAWRVFRESEMLFWFEIVCPRCGHGFGTQYDLITGASEVRDDVSADESAEMFERLYPVLPYWDD